MLNSVARDFDQTWTTTSLIQPTWNDEIEAKPVHSILGKFLFDFGRIE